jgi:hypothetical protein
VPAYAGYAAVRIRAQRPNLREESTPMKTAVCLVGLLVATIAGCGDSSDETAFGSGASPAVAEDCLPVPRQVVRDLDESFKVDAMIEKAAAVESADEGPLPGYRRSGLYFLAATLDGGGLDDVTAVWAVSGDYLKTGGGLVIGADGFANEYSNAGDLPDEDALGLGAGADGFAEAKGCVG